MKQKTIKKAFSINGKGLHSGKEVSLTCQPALADYGIRFQRTDLEGEPIVEALASNVGETNRGTFLKNYNGVEIKTIEHLMSAFAGLGIYNVLVQLSGEEVPILTGNSQPFVEAILSAGIEELDSEQSVFIPRNVIRYTDENTGAELLAIPSDKFSIEVLVDYKTQVLGIQYASLNNSDDYIQEIAPCRTFCFLHDILPMLKANLIKGGDIENAIIYVENDIAEADKNAICSFFNKDNISVNEHGVLNICKLQFDNEVARHKLLDLIGDIALIGKPIQAQIIAKFPGHTVNSQFAKQILNVIKNEKNSPHFDLSKTIIDIEGIKQKLPHRPPFLLVDRIIELTETRVVGVKNVTMNEPHFIGHFPAMAVMPGVLIMEGLAQTGGILILGQVPDPENYLTFFMKMDQVKFRNKVTPGDTLIYEMVLLEPIRRGICHMYGKAYVNGKVVAEGDLMAQITKYK